MFQTIRMEHLMSNFLTTITFSAIFFILGDEIWLPLQLLYLWDLVLAYDSMEVFPLLAAAILSFRKDNLMAVATYANIEAVLNDLSSLPVVPLLQLALERSRILRLNQK